MKGIALLPGLIALLMALPPVNAAQSSVSEGTVQITVVNASGSPVIGAPIYLYGGHIPELGDLRSGDTLKLAEGDYEVGSAWVEKTETGVIPQVSPRAHIHVTPGDTVSVILPLSSVLAESRTLPVGPLAFSSK